jgi:hypothetical protein
MIRLGSSRCLAGLLLALACFGAACNLDKAEPAASPTPEAAKMAAPEAPMSPAAGPARHMPQYTELLERDEQLQGRFRDSRREAERGTMLSSEERAELEKILAIGYLGGSTRAGEESGVTVHDRQKAFPGYNLMTTGQMAEATLTDMEGRVLHRWSLAYDKAFPGVEVTRAKVGTYFWRRVHLLENGELLAIYEGHALIKLDRGSRLLWTYPQMAHHDLDVLPDGRILVLTRVEELVPSVRETEPVVYDWIVELGPDGSERRRVSLLKAIQNSPYAALLQLTKREGELFHTNTLEVLDGSLADKLPAFRAGNVLVAMANINAIAVVDLSEERVVWALPGLWIYPHQPTELQNGNLLLLDNHGDHGWSRVIEFDPLTQQIAWAYNGREHDFFTLTCGTSQRLGNGNTLITESDYGRAFEVAPDGQTVWEYHTPHRAGEHGELIATLFEVVRLPPDLSLDWLDSGSPAPPSER